MKTYVYSEPGTNPLNPIEDHIVTEDEIIEQYWYYWCSKMKQVGKEHLISRERCIEDWITIHWAWEMKDE